MNRKTFMNMKSPDNNFMNYVIIKHEYCLCKYFRRDNIVLYFDEFGDRYNIAFACEKNALIQILQKSCFISIYIFLYQYYVIA